MVNSWLKWWPRSNFLGYSRFFWMLRGAYVGGLVVALFVLGGCESNQQLSFPQLYPVSGTVKYRDGSPAEGCLVRFVSDEFVGIPQGAVRADGTYQIRTSNMKGADDGAPAGNYRVLVSSSKIRPGMTPVRYWNTRTSRLAFEVKVGETNTFDILLTD